MDLSYLFSAAILVHLALVFYVLGLLVRNELLLRSLLLIGTGFYIAYYYYIADTPLWEAIYTSSAIAIANIFMMVVIIREKSTLGMSPEMLKLYESFPTLHPGQFRQVMRKADWVTAKDDTVICQEGKRPDHLYLVSSGQMLLSRRDREVPIDAGNFIGEISFLIGGPASATVIAPKGSEYVRWERENLTRIMDKSPRLSNALAAMFNKDIARKLSVSWPEAGR